MAVRTSSMCCPRSGRGKTNRTVEELEDSFMACGCHASGPAGPGRHRAATGAPKGGPKLHGLPSWDARWRLFERGDATLDSDGIVVGPLSALSQRQTATQVRDPCNLGPVLVCRNRQSGCSWGRSSGRRPPPLQPVARAGFSRPPNYPELSRACQRALLQRRLASDVVCLALPVLRGSTPPECLTCTRPSRVMPHSALTSTFLERTTGFEPATPTLARLCSTN
jgi:hypothetical protein